MNFRWEPGGASYGFLPVLVWTERSGKRFHPAPSDGRIFLWQLPLEAQVLGFYLHSIIKEKKNESTGGTTIAIPAPTEMNTLIWKDPDAGVTFRLQSILDKDTMIRIAENVK